MVTFTKIVILTMMMTRNDVIVLLQKLNEDVLLPRSTMALILRLSDALKIR